MPEKGAAGAAEWRVAEYIAKAVEAEQKAGATADAQVRSTWEGVTKSWRQLAEQIRRGG